MKQVVQTDFAPAAIGPYSQAIEVNGFLFLSGQIPINPSSGSVEETDIKGQTTQVLNNIKAILEAKGLSLDNVVKTTIFIRNMDQFADVNEIYGTYFASMEPARSCVEVSNLPKNVLIEIESIAVV